MTRQLQGVTPIDGIAEEMGFDMDEIYQVLGRDILKSSLLDDIDLYLECDDDSLYVMPTVLSPTHCATADNSLHNISSSRTSTVHDANFAQCASDVNELFDIELDEDTEFSCVDPDVAFPISTFVNCANVEHPSLRDNNVKPLPSATIDHNYVSPNTILKKAKYASKGQMDRVTIGPEEQISTKSIETKAQIAEEHDDQNNSIDCHINDRKERRTTNSYTVFQQVSGNNTADLDVNVAPRKSKGSTVRTEAERQTVDPNVNVAPKQTYVRDQQESDKSLIVPEKAVETEIETTNEEKSPDSAKSASCNEIKITFSIPRHPLIEEDVRYSCTQCKYTCTREILLKDHCAKVHGQKDLFRCLHCDYVGQLFKHLQKHMLRQHKVRLSSVKPGQQKPQGESEKCETLNVELEVKGSEKLNIETDCDKNVENQPEAMPDNLVQNKCQTSKELTEAKSLPQPIGDKVKVQDTNLRQKLIDFLSKFNGNLVIPPKWSGTIKLVSLLKVNVTCDKTSNCAKPDAIPRVYDCDQCEKTFKHKRSLDAHLNAHSGIFLHECHVCEKSFSCKNLLNQHQKTHSTDRAHHCTVSGCTKSFRTNSR